MHQHIVATRTRQRRQLDLPDERHDVGAGEVLVGRLRRALDLEQSEVLPEQLGDRGRGARVELLVDLDEKPAKCPLGLFLSEWACRDRLREPVPFLGHRV
jgi:hypothetical protein